MTYRDQKMNGNGKSDKMDAGSKMMLKKRLQERKREMNGNGGEHSGNGMSSKRCCCN